MCSPGGKNSVPTTPFSRISILRTPGAMYQRSVVTAASFELCSSLDETWPCSKDSCITNGVSTFFFLSLQKRAFFWFSGTNVLPSHDMILHWHLLTWTTSLSESCFMLHTAQLVFITCLKPSLSPGAGFRLQNSPIGSQPKYEPPTEWSRVTMDRTDRGDVWVDIKNGSLII